MSINPIDTSAFQQESRKRRSDVDERIADAAAALPTNDERPLARLRLSNEKRPQNDNIASIAKRQRVVQLSREEQEFDALRVKNQAKHIPLKDFIDLVSFLRVHGEEFVKSEIERGALLEIHTLAIRERKIEKIPNTLCHLKQLRTLDLSGNQLVELPSTIGNLEQLRELDVSNNKLTQLPVSIVRLKNLKWLHVQSNQLTDIPTEVGSLLELRSLDVSHNCISNTRFIDSVAYLEYLSYLNIGFNAFESIPNKLLEIENLATFVISTEQLSLLPDMRNRPDITIQLESGHDEETKKLLILRQFNQAFHIPIGEFKELVDLILLSNQSFQLDRGLLLEIDSIHLVNIHLESLTSSLRYLSKLKQFNCSNNQLVSLPDIWNHFPHLTIINLEKNRLSKLPNSFFKLTQLKDLDLGHNRFTTIPKEFGQLQNLNRLSLSLNKLSTLPEIFDKLVNLKNLLIRQNELIALPDNIGNCLQLETLDLHNNYLIQLPNSLGKLSSLISLYCSNNCIETLPASTCNLSNLKYLDLRRNYLNKLPRQIGQLTSLEYLNVSTNQLAQLPNSMTKLTKLGKLIASNNLLQILPGNLGELSNLKTLLLENNKLSELPKTMGLLTNLEKLKLSNNGIQTLQNSLCLPALKELSLAQNGLTHFPNSTTMPALQTLSLKNNELTSLPDLAHLSSLKKLELSKNHLNQLPSGLGKLERLEVLVADHNDISHLPKELENLKKLKYLEISNNHLSEILCDLSCSSYLETIDLSFNQLESLPEFSKPLYYLKSFRASNNNLSSLPASFGTHINLVSICLKGNSFTVIPQTICALPVLKELLMEDNMIETIPDEIRFLENLVELSLEDNELTSISPEIGSLQRLNKLHLNSNPLRELPMALTNCQRLDHLCCADTGIPDEQVASILTTIITSRNAEESKKLALTLQNWLVHAKTQKPLPEHDLDSEQIGVIHLWLKRLEGTKDFSSKQNEMAKITCEIIETVFLDPRFKERFFNLITADLERCGDRAAMSHNLVYTEWRLHQLPKTASLKEIVSLLESYGRTHKLREYVQKMHGQEAESVELFLYAESKLKHEFNLLSISSFMLYAHLAGDFSLQAAANFLRKFSTAELITPLEYWQQLLENKYPRELEERLSPLQEKKIELYERFEAAKEDLSDEALVNAEIEYQIADNEIERKKEEARTKLTAEILKDL